MVLSKRERNIAVGAISAIVLGGFYYFAWQPYSDWRDAIHKQRDVVAQAQHDAEHLLAKRTRLQVVWTEMQKGGLNAEEEDAASHANHAMHDWAEAAGVALTDFRHEHTTEEGKFKVISFQVDVTGPLRAISRLLYSVETAAIPLRINELQIRPRKEGTDDLTLHLSVSTLCLLPDPSKPRVAMTSAAASGSENFGGK